MCDLFRNEFRTDKFLFSTSEPWKLATSQIARYHMVYLAYRLVMALYWIAMMLHVAINEQRFLMFLTVWVFMGLGISAILQLLTAVHWYLRKGACMPNADNSKSIPLLYRMNWGFYSTFSSLAILVSSVYWLALAFGSSGNEEDQSEREEMTFYNVAVHLLNILYVLLDLCITGVPIKFLHVWMPQTLLLLYASMYALYWKLTGKFAYPEIEVKLHWFTVAAVLVSVFLTIPMCQLVLYCIYVIKIKLYNYFTTKTFEVNGGPNASNIAYIA